METLSLTQLNNLAVSSMQRSSYLQAAETLHKAVLYSFHKSENRHNNRKHHQMNHRSISNKKSGTGEMTNKRELSQHDQNKYENHQPAQQSSQQRPRKRRRRCTCYRDLSSRMDGRRQVLHYVRSLPVHLGAAGNRNASSLAHCMFNHALTIEDHKPSDLSLTTHQSQVKAVLIYNLALSHHVEGLRTNNSKKIALALEAYELAFSILEEVKNIFPMEAMILQLLALFNNMASIHAMRYNLHALTRCIVWMEKAIGSLESEVLKERDFQFFYINVIFFKPRNSISLAAAA